MNTTNDVILLGDSIAGRVRHLPGTDTVYAPGATTRHWLRLLENNRVNIRANIKGCFLMMGTNDIGNGITPADTKENITEIIKILHEKTEADICICSILPRPIDGIKVTKEVRDLNTMLVLLAKQQPNIHFLKTYGPFNRNGKINMSMYMPRYKSGKRDLLHPSYLGACRLRQIIRTARYHYFGKNLSKFNIKKISKV